MGDLGRRRLPRRREGPQTPCASAQVHLLTEEMQRNHPIERSTPRLWLKHESSVWPIDINSINSTPTKEEGPMQSRRNSGFTLVEVLIVVVIMAVLAATVIPQFSDSTTDAKEGTARFNLQSMRSQIEAYKAQHNGSPPATLDLLTVKTTRAGTADPTGPYGPYIQEIPLEPITNSENVEDITGSAAALAAGNVTADGGWLYNTTTGELRVNHVDHLEL